MWKWNEFSRHHNADNYGIRFEDAEATQEAQNGRSMNKLRNILCIFSGFMDSFSFWFLFFVYFLLLFLLPFKYRNGNGTLIFHSFICLQVVSYNVNMKTH